MSRFYIGLATTYHDPAIAVVNDAGDVIFAEGAERCLQSKRAFACAADQRELAQRIIHEHCDIRGEYVIAKSWSRTANRALGMIGLLGLTNHERLARRSKVMGRFLYDRQSLFGAVWMQHVASRLSGGHLADLLGAAGNRQVTFRKYPHHLAHAATGCFTSPFDQAACMVVDGQGEDGSISYFEYRDGAVRLIRRQRGAESLGLLYGFVTELCGFCSEKGEEWKVMGLAPYGNVDAEILAALRSLVSVDGMAIRYPPTREVRRWVERMRRWERPPHEDPLAAADLACTMQEFYRESMTALLRKFYATGVSEDLVLSGGCALNSSYNGQIVGTTGFKRLHVPSAPADDGNALGVAMLAFHEDHPEARRAPRVQSPYLGSAISRQSVANLVAFGRTPKMRHLPGEVHVEAARLLAEGKLLGWVQGRAEFGPRALGNRSILADPRPIDMKERINALVKFREEFRPFAPSILDEFGDEYFENYQWSPYMERTLRFKECVRCKVPAIVHVNSTGRLQTVRREWNERYYALIRAFYELTGVPMVLNTSFNIMGKPIIHSLEDAIGVFYTTGLDALVVEDYLIEK